MHRNDLAKAIADIALLRGQFTLRSGRTSSYYLDKYRLTTRPDLLLPLGKMLAERIRDIHAAQVRGTGGDRGVDRLAGAELGGIPLVTMASVETSIPALFVRNAKKDYGTAKQVEGLFEPGDRVVFVEDVATTGGQAVEAVRVLKELGMVVLGVIAVIDRQEGARQNVENAGARFEALFTKADLGIEE